jgi:hypothetical protein
MTVPIVLLLVIQLVYNPFSWRKVDHFLTFRVMARQFPRREAALLARGVVLPRTAIDYANVINTHAALRELLVRRERRSLALQTLESQASSCAATHGANQPRAAEQQDAGNCSIGRILFVPAVFGWEPQRPGKVAAAAYASLTFDEVEMRQAVEDCGVLLDLPLLLDTYDSLPDADARIQLWSLCSVYYYGGMFVADRRTTTQQQQQQVEDILFDPSSELNSLRPLAPQAVVILETPGGEKEKIALLAATPRHPLLGCFLKIFVTNEKPLDLQRNSITFQGIVPSLTTWNVWQRWSPRGGVCAADYCAGEQLDTRSIGGGMRNFLMLGDALEPSECSVYVRLVRTHHNGGSGGVARPEESRTVTVDITESKEQHGLVIQKKVTMLQQMRQKSATPGYLCDRCLNWAMFGTYEKCSQFCPSKYQELMCDNPDPLEKRDVTVDVNVRGTDPNGANTKAIPRIVHQTYFEHITADRYPHLSRIQNSWKNSGWDFRFYDDETARGYIVDHFPPRFVEAFDALIHGAYKADLFRYLVLMREGGVYADVDVMLEGSLDAFITPSMTFFAPRDIPCEYAGEPFCLWNGFIGAAPGNPILLRTVERLINFIRDRADIYDMEREMCRSVDGPLDVWKVRAQPLLFLSGPCALGVAVNEALNRSSLDSFEIGWIGMDTLSYGTKKDHGDALIMVGDKYDLGEFRISDPERNYIVASTDIRGLDKSPRTGSHPTVGEIRRQSLRHGPLPHYSNSKRGVSIWGAANVYHDDLVSNERIRFNVRYVD